MNCLKCLWNRIRRVSSKGLDEYNAKVAAEVQSHWPENTVAIKELIRERWTDTSKVQAKVDDFNYLVFIDIAGDLDWICDDDHSVKQLTEKASTLIARALSVEAAPCKHLQEQEWMSFKKILGAAIVSAFEESYDEAEALIDQARTYLRQRTEERSRRWMLVNSTVLMLVFWLIECLWFDVNIRTASLFGLFGAYVSIVGHSGGRRTDAGAGRPLHWVEAFVRLLVGIILGNVAIHFFNCSLAPELGRELCTTDAGVRIVAFVAGLIDSFIPSMVSTYVLSPLNCKGESHA